MGYIPYSHSTPKNDTGDTRPPTDGEKAIFGGLILILLIGATILNILECCYKCREDERARAANRPKPPSKILAALDEWIVPDMNSEQIEYFNSWISREQPEPTTSYNNIIKNQYAAFSTICDDSEDNVRYADKNGKTILHHCVNLMKKSTSVSGDDKRQDELLVKTLCDWEASIVANDSNGETPLGIALAKKRFDVVEILIRFGWRNDMNSNTNGQSSLHILVSTYINQKDIDPIKFSKVFGDLLCRKGEDLNKEDKNGVTPLHLVAETFDIKLTMNLERSGMYIYCRTNIEDNLLILICKNLIKKNNESVALKLIDWLLDKGFEANSKNNNNFTPLHYASQLSYDLDIIKRLVKAGADIHAVANDNTNSLLSATMSSNFEVMKYFIERGVDLNRREYVYGFSLIHMAALSYDKKNLDWLIKNGFDVNDVSRFDVTPLHLAAMVGNVKIVEKLIECGARMHVKESDGHRTPLHFAAIAGKYMTTLNPITMLGEKSIENTSLIKHCLSNFKLKANKNDYRALVVALLKAGADVNAKDQRGRTPLHYITQQSHNNLIEVILAADGHIDNLDSESSWPSLDCSFSGNVEVLEQLLMYGTLLNNKKFDANSKNKYNFTPLHYASQVLYDLVVIKSLVKAGANIHAVANDNTNPLHSATMLSSFEVMEYFVKQGALNRKDNVYGFSLVHMAALNYDERNLNWLVGNGSNPNDVSKFNVSPLHLAALIGNVKIVEKLIEIGANVNVKESHCLFTPLHLAVMGSNCFGILKLNTILGGKYNENRSLVRHCLSNFKLKATKNDYKDIVLMLLKAGANVNARDRQGCTPLHHVTRESNNNLLSELLEADTLIDDLDYNCFLPIHYCLLNGNNTGLEYLLISGANVNDIRHATKNVLKETKESALHNLSYFYLLRHVVKMEVAQLRINEIYKPYLNDKNLNQHYKKCMHEVLQLKVKMLAQDVSFYDLLHMNSKCIVTLADNLPPDLEIKFPLYHVLITGRCNSAVNERSLIKIAKKSYQSLTGFHWPDLCVEYILSFLDNSSLRNLIDSV